MITTVTKSWEQLQQKEREEPFIPNIIHMIWVGKRSIPTYALSNFEKIKQIMPDFTCFLWTNDNYESVVDDPIILEQIHNCTTGVQQADILKYYVVFKFGGFYVDTDVIPHRSFEELRYHCDLVICHYNIIEWAFIAVGFFGSSANHPTLEKAVSMTKQAVLNDGSPHLATGPGLFGRAFFETGIEALILSIQAFYCNNNVKERYGHHFFACDWNENDETSDVSSKRYEEVTQLLQ